MGFSLVAASGGHSLVAVYRLLVAAASLVAKCSRPLSGDSTYDSQAPEHMLDSCGAWA